MNKILTALAVCAGIALQSVPGLATAQGTYPNKPLRVIVPFGPGSGLDLTVRLMSEKFTAMTGQRMYIDNKGGAGGIIGNEAIARSAPDGYTIGLSTINMLSINPHLYKKLSYDPLKSFEHIMQVTQSNHTLAILPSLSANNLKEFVAWVKQNPGKVSIATNGAGTTPHLLAVLVNKHMGTDLVPIHYKGGGAAAKDFLGGQVQAIFGSPAQMIPHLRAGKAKILAIARSDRSPLLPNVPTFKELGYPDMVVDIWTAYIAPAGTPQPMIKKLHATFAQILEMPDVIKRLDEQGNAIIKSDPEHLRALIVGELARWKEVVKESGWQVR